MLDENNLNLISRMELLDTLKVLPSGEANTPASKQITDLLNSTPVKQAKHSQDDVFDIQFERDVLGAIATPSNSMLTTARNPTSSPSKKALTNI